MERNELTGAKLVAERLWLTYFNNVLFEKGVISEKERNKMIIAIKNWQGPSGDILRKLS